MGIWGWMKQFIPVIALRQHWQSGERGYKAPSYSAARMYRQDLPCLFVKRSKSHIAKLTGFHPRINSSW